MILSFVTTRGTASHTLELDLDVVDGEIEICLVTEGGADVEFFPTRVEMAAIRAAFVAAGARAAA